MQSAVATNDDVRPDAVQMPHGRVGHHATILAISVAVLVASFALKLEGERQAVELPGGFLIPTLCWSNGLFSVECPGCGLTRSFVAIAHGDFAAAWRYNPAGFAWFAAVALQVPLRLLLIHQTRAGRSPSWLPAFTAVTWTTLIGACLVQWGARFIT